MQFFNFDGGAALPRKDETLVEYWMSYFPVAPMMGLDWRPAQIWGIDTTALLGTPASAVSERVMAPVEDAVVVAEKIVEDVAEMADAASEAALDIVETAVEATADAVPEAAPEAVLPGGPSDLTMIKGIGPKLEKQLNELGLHTVAQLARYTDTQVADLSAAMTAFKDRPVRDDWVGQAKALTK